MLFLLLIMMMRTSENMMIVVMMKLGFVSLCVCILPYKHHNIKQFFFFFSSPLGSQPPYTPVHVSPSTYSILITIKINIIFCIFIVETTNRLMRCTHIHTHTHTHEHNRKCLCARKSEMLILLLCVVFLKYSPIINIEEHHHHHHHHQQQQQQKEEKSEEFCIELSLLY